jgi:hypothetical protein
MTIPASSLALSDADGFPLAFLQFVCYTDSWQKSRGGKYLLP